MACLALALHLLITHLWFQLELQVIPRNASLNPPEANFSTSTSKSIVVSTVHSPLLTSTVLCKSNANDNRRISRFVLAIYRRYISETSHGSTNVKTINQRDIGTIFAISRRDIVPARLHCNDISQSETIYRCSEVRCNDIS